MAKLVLPGLVPGTTWQRSSKKDVDGRDIQAARGAALRGLMAADCLASDIDFAITLRNELLRVRN